MARKAYLWGMLAVALVFVSCGGGDGDPELTGSVSITGTAQVGQTLTANTGSLSGSGTISYQWKRGTTNIGTNSSTYELQADDEGSTITVTVTRAGYTGSVTSTATAAVAPNTLPALTGSVTITGTAMVGQVLTANTDSLEGTGDISYQWKRGDSEAEAGANIDDAVESTYELAAADEGKYITVTVTRTGNSESVTSEATGAVAPIPALAGTVSITGTAKIGQTLTADTGSLEGTGDISYQWRSTSAGGNTFTDITGANEATYLLTKDDYNRLFVVVVTRAGYSGSATSTATSRVADVMSWTAVTQSVFTSSININKIAYNGTDQWVAVGGSRIASSANGTTWDTGDYVNLSGTFNSVAYGGISALGNKWVAVGSGGQMYASADGKTPWTSLNADAIFDNGGAKLEISDIVANSGSQARWVVIGSGRAGYSFNGTAWAAPDTQLEGMTTAKIATDNKNDYLIVGGKNIATSMGGTSWIGTPRDLSNIFTGSNTIQAIAYGDNLWVAAGTGGIMATSTNGSTWTLVPGDPFGTGTVYGIAYDNGKFIAVGSDSTTNLGVAAGSRIAVSSDGVNWASVANTAFGNNQIKSVAYGGGKWVAVGNNGSVAYADDN